MDCLFSLPHGNVSIRFSVACWVLLLTEDIERVANSAPKAWTVTVSPVITMLFMVVNQTFLVFTDE